MKTCVIIPVYNYQETIAHVIEQLKPFGLPCYQVNDGSSIQVLWRLPHLLLRHRR